jgi:capsular exopolysaccharide synthesis family protein
MPADGKTFAAINLASVYSLLNKRTVLVGFDLRKPKIFQDFGLSNEKGVSTWLIGQDKIQDILQTTRFDNFSIISAGPIPPNPSELTALGKTEELFSYLREKFDYIIVDTSPVGLVSDTYHLASMADTVLLVVRPGKTLRELLDRTLMEIKSSSIKGVGMLVNDIQAGSGHYGYGEKYGYTSDKGKSKKRLLRKALLRRK